jgi:hypothetical protein
VTDSVLGALQHLREVLEDEESLGAALAHIAESATSSVPGCDAASIAISLEGRPMTAATTARIALELDMTQHDSHGGPRVSSLRLVAPPASTSPSARTGSRTSPELRNYEESEVFSRYLRCGVTTSSAH